ncbi:MAG: efflux RND transporter periplasmic adaptor subunit [Phascolarctobacterium sp.]|nr:efflux RND transporter periplasmic adaptor subunit [Phascolarctobacterium sp.]
MLDFIRSARTKKAVAIALATGITLSFAACKKEQPKGNAAIAVKTMEVIKRDTPITYDFNGFVEAQQEAKLMANVSGKIISKNFKGGDTVQAGQVLFTIDQRSYTANLLSAQANLSSAKTEHLRLVTDADRYAKLYEQNAVSKQTYDNIIAQRDQAQAQVAACEAIVANAEVSMTDTQVRAPFSGRISTSDLSVGNFVTQGQTVMATMSNVNPIRVKFSISENEYLTLTETNKNKGAKGLSDLSLVLSDGKTYPVKGVVEQVDRGVGEGTGALTIKALFANDDNLLMPGMFARVQANSGIVKDAMLVPQRAVKELLYKKFVYTVDKENKVDMKEVKLGARVGRLWLVESGLNGDETLVVEGIQKVNKGSVVKPTPMTEADLDTTQTAAPAEAKK